MTSSSVVVPGESSLRYLFRGAQSPPEYFLALARKHGDVARLKRVGGDIYVVSHPDPAREILQTQRDAFGRQDLVSRRMRTVFGNGLVVSEGETWRQERRLMQEFFSARGAARHFDTIIDTAEKTARGWDAHASAGREVDVGEEMRQATLRILMTSIFTTDGEGGNEYLEAALQAGGDFIASSLPANLPAWTPLPVHRRRRRTADRLNRYIAGLIAERRACREPPGDLLTLLLHGADGAAPPDDSLIVDEVRSMFAAGHVTITAALSWFWHLMSLHPGHQSALRSEVKSVLGDEPLTRERMRELPLTTALLDETLRLYPPVWSIWRSAVHEVSLTGADIPAGAAVVVCIYGIHRHAAIWPEPDAFVPGRPAPAHESAFMPFGLGPRRCIGANLATLEMMAMITSIARRFVVRPARDTGPGIDARVALRPRPGVKVLLQRD